MIMYMYMYVYINIYIHIYIYAYPLDALVDIRFRKKAVMAKRFELIVWRK